MAYDPEKDLAAEEAKQHDDSLTKLRRDRGKMEEIFSKLTLALEFRGGKAEHVFALLGAGDSVSIDSIAAYLMGVYEMMPIDPLRIVTQTGKSDRVRADAVQSLPADQQPWEMLLNDDGKGLPRTRVAIAIRVTDENALKEIAINGGPAESCIAARKLDGVDVLYEIAVQGEWDTTAYEIIDRLPLEKLTEFVHECEEGLRVVAAVKRMTDPAEVWWVNRHWGECRPDIMTDPHFTPCSHVSQVTKAAHERLKELVAGGATLPPDAVI